jgi:acetyl esterase/lipase
MNARGTAGRLLVGLTIVVLLGGCAAGASPTPAPASSSPAANPSAAVATPSPTVAAAATPATTPSVVVTSDVAYESANPVLTPGVLDVYAPAKAGPWPVVVMFHGFQGDKRNQREYARRVADLGFVVFAATWASGMPTIGSYRQASFSQTACAVAFARAHAAEYGGDAATMVVFGHSAGAHAAATLAFARPEPTAGCLGGATLGAIDALVTWEGNWLLSATEPSIMDWDGTLAADPGIMAEVTPWAKLAEHKDLKVVMLVSDHPGAFFEREVGDPWAADSWLAVRDPSGDLRRQLEANGALADGIFDFVDAQQLLFSILRAQGNPVTLDVMPDSVHDRLGTAGWPVFLAAFPKAAAHD